MTTNRRRSPLTDEQLADAARLKALWLKAKRADRSMTQARVAHECGWNTQSAFSQFVNGAVALNLPAVLRIARVLGCAPKDISPSLAAQVTVPTLPADAQELLSLLEACPDLEHRADILRYARLVVRDARAAARARSAAQ